LRLAVRGSSPRYSCYPPIIPVDYCIFARAMCEDAWMRGKGKKRKKAFSAAKVVREMARERVGSPKPSRAVPARKTKPEKYKPTLGMLLEDQ